MPEQRFNFQNFLGLDTSDVWLKLVETHETLANLHDRIGYIKGEKARNPKEVYVLTELYEKEELVKGYDEQKWILIRILEARRG